MAVRPGAPESRAATIPRPVALRAFVDALAEREVRYVLAGSVAARAWGAGTGSFGDFDIVPSLEPANLAKLGTLLAKWGARPVHRPDWKRTLSPEECARWRPEPPNAEQLDHQFETPSGLFDVVPHVAGEYEALITRAIAVHAWGVEVWIAHPDDLVATLRPDPGGKHHMRLAPLEAARLRAAAGGCPRSLEHLYPEEP